MNNQNSFYSLFEKSCNVFNEKLEILFMKFFNVWIESGDHIVNPAQRKISSIALLSLLPTENEIILNNFNVILNQSIESLYEIDDEFLQSTYMF